MITVNNDIEHTLNFAFLKYCKDHPDFKGCGLEGASRTAKTYDSCQFVIDYLYENTGKQIVIARDTFANLKATTYQTLKQVWQHRGLPDHHFNKSATPIYFNGNTITFVGVNDNLMKAHGLESHLLWVNEAMGIAKDTADQLEQRNIEFFWYDYNPSAIDSWLFDLEKREDYLIHKSTIFDNPYAPANAKAKILSYEPTERNIELGTADRYKWEVYGLGKRAVSEDVIFTNWDLYSEDKTSYDWKLYGGDFGYKNDPTALIEVIKDGSNLYIKELIFETGLLNTDIANIMKSNHLLDEVSVWDSAEQKSIDELRINDIPADYAQKWAGSISWGIQKIQQFKVHIHVNSVNLQNEFRKYSWAKSPNGDYKRNTLGKRVPIDKYNHGIDAVRYALTRYLETSNEAA